MELVDTVRKAGKTAAAEEWVREQEKARGQYIESHGFAWYNSLHYSDQVWDVLHDREWSIKRAALRATSWNG